MTPVAHLSARCQHEIAHGGTSKAWQEITALARAPGVVDLGQGYPDFHDAEGPGAISWQTAAKALSEGGSSNQYAPIPGLGTLTEALADHYTRCRGRTITPDMVLVTTSGTEGIFAVMQGLVDPGDEVSRVGNVSLH